MKRCAKCGETKPYSEFHRDRHQKDGYKFRCAECARAATNQWFAEHPDYRREYRANNRDALAEYNRQYRADHPRQFADYASSYYLSNKERLRAVRWDWEERNRDARTERQVVAYWADPDEARRKSRERPRDLSKDADRAQRRRAKQHDQWVEDVDRRIVFVRDAGICGLCGLLVMEDFWELDHIIPIRRMGEHSYANTRVAHPSCNGWKKDRLDNELPAMPPHILAKAQREAALAA